MTATIPVRRRPDLRAVVDRFTAVAGRPNLYASALLIAAFLGVMWVLWSAILIDPHTRRHVAAEITARYGVTVDHDQVGSLPTRYGQSVAGVVVDVAGKPESCSVTRSRAHEVLVFCGAGSTELPVVGR